MNEYHDRSMPIGLAVLLAENGDAMRSFALMTDAEQQQVLEAARRVGSRAQMSALVGGIAAHAAIPDGGPIAPGLVGGGLDRYDDPRQR